MNWFALLKCQKLRLLSKILCGILLVIGFTTIVSPVEAATCKIIADQQVCLTRIKRSAKYYWEYRVTLKIDGKKQPERVYNCRDSYYFQANKNKTYYSKNDFLAKDICRLYRN